MSTPDGPAAGRLTIEWRRQSPAQWFCLIGGVILLVRGGAGLLIDPAFESPGEGWHQLIHLSSGVLLLVAAGRASRALVAALAFGVFYAAVAFVGFIDGQDVAGVIPVQSGDNLLHTVLTVTSLGAGMLSLRERPASPRAT